MTISHCTNWPNNDPNTCKDNAPQGTIGWIKCAIGSDPTTTSCSPYTPNDFSCVWGQECYAVTSFVDSTTFSEPTNPTCDSTGNKISYSKCTNWGNNDPKSCSNSPKKPQGIVGWMACLTGALPNNTSGLGCSPISSGPNENTCALGQDCYAITTFAPDSSCKKSGIAAVSSVLSGDSLPSSTTIIIVLLLILSIIVAMMFLF
jgi:hypothetical protein